LNTVEQFFAWWHAPASHAGQSGGWLDWFNVLSIGWKTDAPNPPAVSPAPTMMDVTNGEVLVGLLDRLIK
jgi:hypothetical protein